MSYLRFRQQCDDCKATWNAAFGIVGTTYIAQPPVKCPHCGSEKIASPKWIDRNKKAETGQVWSIILIGGALLTASFIVVFLGTVAIRVINRPVPPCNFVDGREIVTGHCIPYCPPDPKECG